jgi:hypothetical protein
VSEPCRLRRASVKCKGILYGRQIGSLSGIEDLLKISLLSLVLHHFCQLLPRPACEWAGVPLTDSEAGRRTHEFAAMIEGAGSVGPRN